MIIRPIVWALLILGLSNMSSLAIAGGGSGCCPPCPPKIQFVEKTVYVPHYSTEMRKVVCTVFDPKPVQRKYTVYRCVPETKQVMRKMTVMVPTPRQRTETFVVHIPQTHYVDREFVTTVPVWRDVERDCQVQVPYWEDQEVMRTVMVPHREIHQGVRRVCRRVPVKQTRTVCRDQGQWETREIKHGCHRNCGTCSRCCEPRVTTCKVWVPNLVKQQVEVTVYRSKWVDEAYDYAVTVCKPEEQKKTVRVCRYKTVNRKVIDRVCDYKTVKKVRKVPVCHYKAVEQTREVHYTVCVPKTVEKLCNITTYKEVAQEVTETCTVMVPRQVEREVAVPVCQMVPKTIKVPVCVPCGCCR